jgi:RNA polymerase-binding transcription factor DksA
LSDANEQANAKELLEKLRKEIEDASELNDKEKERALKQVKSLVETLQMKTQVQTDSGLQERAENAITLIRGIVAGISSAVSIFKVLSEISSLFGIA